MPFSMIAFESSLEDIRMVVDEFLVDKGGDEKSFTGAKSGPRCNECDLLGSRAKISLPIRRQNFNRKPDSILQ